MIFKPSILTLLGLSVFSVMAELDEKSEYPQRTLNIWIQDLFICGNGTCISELNPAIAKVGADLCTQTVVGEVDSDNLCNQFLKLNGVTYTWKDCDPNAVWRANPPGIFVATLNTASGKLLGNCFTTPQALGDSGPDMDCGMLANHPNATIQGTNFAQIANCSVMW